MRGVAGGAIVGMPLLYTMEVWWHGMTLSEWHLLALLGTILFTNLLFSLLSGFRESYSLQDALLEAVTSVGIGIVFSTIVLWLIGELSYDVAPAEIAGKVLIEAMVVSVGVSFANSQLSGKSRTGNDKGGNGEAGEEKQPDGTQDDPERLQLKEDLVDIAATLAGSTVFALNIAPTEEVLMIASRLSPWQQLALLGASLLLCYIILFASGLDESPVHVGSVFQHPLAETVMACALSLIVAAGLLALLGQREVMSNPATAVAAVVTLGLPAIVGGAAGRIIA